jgi:uncharacterized cofD-like protein
VSPAASPKIACVGGGHGLSAALRAARRLTDRVSAIVTVADDGGSSGVLRRQLGIPAPGDLRMAIAALAADEEREGLIQYRFREGELAGHPLGNLLIAALADLRGDFAQAVSEVARLAGVVGRVLPTTTTPVSLVARMNGQEIRGQVPIARGPGPVERMWLEPSEAKAHHETIEALEDADLVVLGPGSLFTSVAAALIVPGVGEATSRAGHVAMVLNLVQQVGETLGLDAADHVRDLRGHCPGLRLDAVLVHDDPYLERPHVVRVDDGALAVLGVPVLRADLTVDGLRHDPERLATALKQLL